MVTNMQLPRIQLRLTIKENKQIQMFEPSCSKIHIIFLQDGKGGTTAE